MRATAREVRNVSTKFPFPFPPLYADLSVHHTRFRVYQCGTVRPAPLPGAPDLESRAAYGRRHFLHRRAGALHRVGAAICEVRFGARTT